MMIPHHSSVIVMAEEEIKNGEDSRLKKMVQTIIDTQTMEIARWERC